MANSYCHLFTHSGFLLHGVALLYIFCVQITEEAVSQLCPAFQSPSGSVSRTLLYPLFRVSKLLPSQSGYEEIGKRVTGMRPCSVTVSVWFCYILEIGSHTAAQAGLELLLLRMILFHLLSKAGPPTRPSSDYFCSPASQLAIVSKPVTNKPSKQ